MDKKEKFFWILGYTAIAMLTLLPFFQVGFTNSDDFQYYNTAHNSLSYWLFDSKVYAEGSGRFYFLITKYFYYVPYIFNSILWTKTMQYLPLMGCYVLFSYLVFRIFKSKRLGALALLLLIFNTSVGIDAFYPPTAYPFYFSFSLLVFLSGILLFVNYIEKGGYWRIIVSAVLFFVAYLFYEVYLVFTLLFGLCVLIGRWKNKQFFKEIVPYAVAALLYVAIYVGYRRHLINTMGDTGMYAGAVVSDSFSWTNFFRIIFRFTFYTLPGRIFGFDDVKTIIAENTQFIEGQYDSVGFVLSHAPLAAYLNALIQSVMLWFLIKKADFKKISSKTFVYGAVYALSFAFLSHILIAVTGKYNSSDMSWMRSYVTSFYSYFGVMLAIVLVLAVVLKLKMPDKLKLCVKVACCLVLFGFSVVVYYTNHYLAMEWKKSQNRITVLETIGETDFFDKIPDKSVIYVESLHRISPTSYKVCYDCYDFARLINKMSGKRYSYVMNWDELQDQIKACPDMPVYFIQAAETKKNGELLMAFSHITHVGEDAAGSVADEADVYYYSPTKNYVLFYTLNDDTGSIIHKSVKVESDDLHRKVMHVTLNQEGMKPLGFSVSNML